MKEYIGRLISLERSSTLPSPIFVVTEIDEKLHRLFIVELDAPNDGEHGWYSLDDLHILTPIEILERVTEWD